MSEFESVVQSLSFGTVWIEMLSDSPTLGMSYCHCPSGRCGLKCAMHCSGLAGYGSLSFGTVWIEMCRRTRSKALTRSLSFGTVWIEILSPPNITMRARVTVLRDGVD